MSKKHTLKKSIANAIYGGCVALGKYDLECWWELDTNIITLDPIVQEYDNKRKVVIDKYAKKGADGRPVIIENIFYDFGKNLDKAEKLLSDIGDETVEVEIHEIVRSQLNGTKLPANAMKPLIGIVIIEG